MVRGVPFDKQRAKEAGAAGGRASAEARKARKQLAADLRFVRKLEDQAEELGDRLLDAAFGRGTFAGLDPKDQLQALKFAIEQGVGRPAARKPALPAAEEADETSREGLGFAVRAEEDAEEGDVQVEGAQDPGPGDA